MRRAFIVHSIAAALTLIATASAQDTPSVCLANGVKIGEIYADSAIIWTRLTRHPERNLKGLSWGNDSEIPEGKSLGEMHGAVPGTPGKVRITWSLDGAPTRETEWLAVDPEKDFTRQVKLTELTPGEQYTVTVSSKGPDDTTGQTVTANFRTAPAPDKAAPDKAAPDKAAPVSFTVVTGQEYSRRDDDANGHMIYQSMEALKPDFFVHTGDIVYYDFHGSDPKAQSESLARFKWNRMYALPFQRSFHNAVGSYFIKDDHDTVKNDCWPGQSYGDLTWEQGLALFREQVPMGGKTYRTVRWGKDLQIWLVEGRDFRSPNRMPDGPEKTIWGSEQKQWFFDTVNRSDATFRILISPTPIVGPDRGNKHDNHANKGFTHEGNEIRSFIAGQKNMLVVCGDRHWQYVSVDSATGVREYSCGPTSMEHAGGFSEEQRSDMHRYLNVVGGFLSVNIEQHEGSPVAKFRHYGVDGTILNEDLVKAE